MQKLIEECIINLSHEYPDQGVCDVLVEFRPTDQDTLDMLRAKFFILLNKDMQMKKKLSVFQGKSKIVKEVCDHKAVIFYHELDTNIIPSYAQNQKIPLATFVENIRDVYTYS